MTRHAAIPTTPQQGHTKMGARATRWRRTGAAFLLVASTLSAAAVARPAAVRAAVPSSGVVCTTSSSPNASFSLTAGADYISMPDGNSIWTWSYGPSGGAFQFPGPILCVNQGDTVTVVLHNSLPEATSIMFAGIDGVQVNGALAQPEFNGPAGALSSLTNSAPRRRQRDVHLRGRQPGHLPVRERNRRRQAGPDGALRRPDRAPDGPRRTGPTPTAASRSASSTRPTSS